MVVSWRKYLTVEPVLFLYCYGLLMHVPVIQQYIYYRMSEAEGFPYKPGQNQSCDDGNLNVTMKELEKKVQSLSSYVHLGIVLCSSIPSIFVALFMGGWTDKVGRRPGIISPCIGSTLEVIVCLGTIYFKLPLYVLFVGGLLHGVFGYFTTITLSCIAYIADTTEESQRAFRLGIIELLVFMGGVVSQLTSGLWIDKFGFVAPYLFISACLLASVLYGVFLVPESRRPRPRNQRGSLFSLDNARSALRAYKDAPPVRRTNLILLTVCDGIVNIDTQGVSGVITLLLLHSPLCFSPELVGYYTALRLFTMGLGAAVGIKLCGLCMKELNISRIGMLSMLVYLIFTGFSRSKLIFIGPALGFFSSCSMPTFKGMMSKLIGPDQQGSLFSAVASIETLCTLVGAALFSSLYPVSLKFGLSEGFVFFLGASLLVIPLVLSSFVKFTASIQIEEVTKNHNEEEKQEEAQDGNDNSPLIT